MKPNSRHSGARYEPWAIDAGAFPARGSIEDQLRFLLRYAILAPSSHNAQPWLFRVAADTVEVYADRRRSLPVCDPDDRQLLMGCGAALRNLEVALRGFHLEPEVELWPDADEADFLARVRAGAPREPTEEECAHLTSIPRRRTNRSEFEHRPVPSEVMTDLARRAHSDGTWLEALEGETKWRVAALVAEADQAQGRDHDFRQELAAWLQATPSHRNDGMPMYAVGLKGLASYVGPLLVRTFDVGQGRAARDRQLAAKSPALAVLGTVEDAPRAWLKAGQALASLLLHATSQGLAASYLGQPVEIPELRQRLGKLLEQPGHPQLVLRLGYGPEVPPAPRRPLEDVLIA